MKDIKKVILKTGLSPGDVIMLTSAVRDLKKAHPNFQIDVRTPAMQIWQHNPYLTNLDEKDPEVNIIKVEYPLIHRSNTGPFHFIHGYRMFLEEALGIKIPAGEFKGDIHLSPQEKTWISQVEEMKIKDDFWIVMSGGKYDFTAKWWSPVELQKVIDHFRGKILFVQCGEKGHFHPELKSTINLVGKTDTRQFIRLVYHSSGVLCPITFAMHLAAAVPMKPNQPKNRACVVWAGGREPAQWEAYPNHRYLSTNGALMCCDNGGCWKSRCMTVGDKDSKDTNNLCIYPTEINYKIKMPLKSAEENMKIARCLDMIKAEDVIKAIEMYYIGGALRYNCNTIIES
jgi:ADP-heptose:LPS heptosyltransferase